MNPRFGRRTWVKLWVDEWLDGTTRFEMSDAQRAFWIDLLALAGRSRFPGRICPGEVDGSYVGYPLSKFQSLMAEPMDVEATLRLFEKSGKIRLTVTSESPVRLVMIELVNWDRYQSDYQRQKKYRNGRLQRSDPRSYTASNKTEGEGELEIEKEKRQKMSNAASAAQIARAFDALGHKPFGSPQFQNMWAEEYTNAGQDPNWTDVMELAIQRCQSLQVKVPGLFFKHKREIEDGQVKMRYKVAPL
jgi:hypothetical protein